MFQQDAGLTVSQVARSPLSTDTVPAPSLAPHEGQESVSIALGGLTKDVEIELYGTSRTAAPGGLVMVRYSINSYEDTDERVRVRLHLPTGWTLLDRDIEEREFLLEAWEDIEGEIRVAVPQDARPGERHMIRVVGEVIGEPGGAAVFSYVQVTRRGGLQVGQVGLTGTTSVHATNFAVEDFAGARYGGVVDLSGKLARNTTLSLNYRQGPRESNLTNFRISQEVTRWSGTLRNPGWTLQFGNQVNSSGSVLTGPYVRGQGASLRRTQGLLIGDLVVAQPTTFNSAPAGHVVRGSVGLSGRRGRVAATFSDFGRPVGGYSTAPIYPESIDPDSLEWLERERKALERAPSNRVRGAGLDMELRAANVHRFQLRGGLLRLVNAAGDTIADPSGEAQYSLSHRRATFTARWRGMPESLQGIHLPGNEMSADGSLKLIGDWRLAGRAYRNSNYTLGNSFHSENEGGSFGVRWFRQGWRMDVRGSYREWSYGEQPTIARTVNATFGMPVGPLSFSAFANVGEQQRDTLRQPTQSYRGDLRWSGKAGSASWSASYFETLNAPPRLRTDVLGSLKHRDWEVAGGAWATRGLVRGGEPGFWTQVGIPVTYDLLLSVGIEHAPPAYGKSPEWMGTLGVRQKVTLAIPFLRDGSVPRPSQTAPSD
jgi:hypothetical protein